MIRRLSVMLLLGCGCSMATAGALTPGGDSAGASPRDGQCGGASGVSSASAPGSDLCSTGTASSPSGSGPWSWTCAGVNGGTEASCSASLAGPEGSKLPTAGNPDGHCTTLSLPAEAKAVDVSKPTTVVGSGTAASCTAEALVSAVKKGGIITFDCGPDLVTLTLSETLTPPTSNAYASEPALHIVIDGGNKVTVSGAGKVRILDWTHEGSWQKNEDTLTLQHLRFINGKATPKEAIPACPASGSHPNTECSQGFNDGEGGALYMRDGSLRIIDATFAGNQAALLGPDTGGGALYVTGTGKPIYIASSTFQGNKASNAGAIGMLWAGAFIFDSLFDGNAAVGTGANNNEPSKCTCMNNGQNETGSGGNGGAIYKDGGDNQDVTVCGSQIRNNTANEFGAAIFLTADGSTAKLVIDDSTVKSNPSPIPYWQWCHSVATDNPHASGTPTSSPAPVKSTFCDDTGANCTSDCTS